MTIPTIPKPRIATIAITRMTITTLTMTIPKPSTTRIAILSNYSNVENNNDHNNCNETTYNNHTGVCKINGVVIVVNGCCSIGFSTTINNKNTVVFANNHSNNKNAHDNNDNDCDKCCNDKACNNNDSNNDNDNSNNNANHDKQQ